LDQRFFKLLKIIYFAEGNTWMGHNTGRSLIKREFGETFPAARFK
jgi:hypothetical protein